MKPIISAKTQGFFAPFFIAFIGGQQKQITLEQFKTQWPTYVHTGIGYLYENQQELIQYLKKHETPVETVELNMEQAAHRGLAFSGKSITPKTDRLALFIKKQTAKRARLSERLKRLKMADELIASEPVNTPETTTTGQLEIPQATEEEKPKITRRTRKPPAKK